MDFEEKYKALLALFQKGKPMVLSTSLNDKVTSRMMSIVLLDERFYFQTDLSFRKYEQLKENSNVALCIDNIQIEGLCREIGRPADSPAFMEAYQTSFRSSYERYSSLSSERLFEITPTFIERWLYINSVPYMEIFDVKKRSYSLTLYEGV